MAEQNPEAKPLEPLEDINKRLQKMLIQQATELKKKQDEERQEADAEQLKQYEKLIKR